ASGGFKGTRCDEYEAFRRESRRAAFARTSLEFQRIQDDLAPDRVLVDLDGPAQGHLARERVKRFLLAPSVLGAVAERTARTPAIIVRAIIAKKAGRVDPEIRSLDDVEANALSLAFGQVGPPFL